MLSHQVSPLPR